MFVSDTPSIAIGLGLLGLIVVVYAVKVCYQLLCSPLNSANDAHWSVKFCGVWIWYHRVLERETKAIHDAHLLLGPVVRLGPRELSINDVDGGLKPIYDGRLPKTDFYQAANSYGEEPLVGLKDDESHRRRIRILAKPYGKTYLKSSESWHAEQMKLVNDLISGLEDYAETNSAIEFYDVFFAWSVASISTYVFGPHAALNLLHDFPEAGRVRHQYFSQRMYLFVALSLPCIPTKLLAWLGYAQEVSWIRRMQIKAKERTNEGWITTHDYMKLGMDAGRSKESTISTSMSTKEAAIFASEMQDHIVAGIETSATALVTCAWLLSLDSNRQWQEKLRAEIRANPELTHGEDMEQLPVLNAIIKETLRLYSPVSGGQPRMTDKVVVLGPPGCEVTAPPGVEVHCQAYSLHRSSIFKDPEAFNPGRWLTSTAEEKREMELWFWAFGSGSRRCIGQHLGLSNLRAAIAAVWGKFETQVTEQTQLVMSEGVIAMPVLNEHGNYMQLKVQKVQ